MVKKRGEVTVAATASETMIKEAVLALDFVQAQLGEKPMKKLLLFHKGL